MSSFARLTAIVIVGFCTCFSYAQDTPPVKSFSPSGRTESMPGANAPSTQFTLQDFAPASDRTTETNAAGPQDLNSTGAPQHSQLAPMQDAAANQLRLANDPTSRRKDDRSGRRINPMVVAGSASLQPTQTPRNESGDLGGNHWNQPYIADPSAQLGNNTTIANETRSSADSRLIQPVSFENASPQSAAEQLLKTIEPASGALESPGKSVSLVELVATTPLESLPEMIRDYWRCFECWANLNSAKSELSDLSMLNHSTGLEATILQAAQSVAQSRLLSAQMEMTASQNRLLRYSPSLDSQDLPFPSSQPLVGEYETRYSVLAARVPLDPRLHSIDSLLANMLHSIQDLAAASLQGRDAVSMYISAFNQRQASLGETMNAIRVCHQSHDEFFHAVGRYNLAISDYALSVAPYGQSPQQVVAMLIKPSAATTDSPISRVADARSAAEPKSSSAGITFSNISGTAVPTQFTDAPGQSNVMRSAYPVAPVKSSDQNSASAPPQNVPTYGSSFPNYGNNSASISVENSPRGQFDPNRNLNRPSTESPAPPANSPSALFK